MKYAFIALIACYLLVYGCGPDNAKKAGDNPDKAVHSTVEKPQPPAPSILAVQPQGPGEQPATPAVIQQPAQPTVAESPAAKDQQPTTGAATEATQAAIVAQQLQAAAAAEKQQLPCPMMTGEQAVQQPAEGVMVMPCGHVFARRAVPPADAPCLKSQPCPCWMTGEEHAAGEARQQPGEDIVVMPCGRAFTRQQFPADAPCLEHQQQLEMLEQDEAQSEGVTESDQDLTMAMQRMVEATNDMVLVTRQLVMATQGMLKATREAAPQTGNTDQQVLRPEQGPQPTGQAAETGSLNQTAVGEQRTVKAMLDAVLATKKAVEATTRAVSKALEPKQQ
jgi:hypothetical protein